MKEISAPAPAAAPSVQEAGKRTALSLQGCDCMAALFPILSAACHLWFRTEPVLQVNTWVSCDPSTVALPAVRSPRLADEQVYLEDVHMDEDRLNGSMLSSESTFLPFTPDLEPQTNRSDSEDETETFEPDSLAPKRPAQPKRHNPTKTHQSPPGDRLQRGLGGEVICVSVPTSDMPQNDLEASSDFGKAEAKETTKHKEAGVWSSEESERAAVRIQSWWRGQFTRCCHPVAREVRSEIRLRRMQEHIVFLTEKFER